MTERMEKLRKAYEEFGRMIFSVAFHSTQNVEEAEDIVQEVFVRYAKKIDNTRLTEHPRYWLIRVAVNLCIDRKRKLKRFFNSFFDMGNFYRSYAHSHENNLELTDEVKWILSGLPLRSRMVLILKYMEDMEYSEISEILNIPQGTLKAISSRAIAKLRRKRK